MTQLAQLGTLDSEDDDDARLTGATTAADKAEVRSRGGIECLFGSGWAPGIQVAGEVRLYMRYSRYLEQQTDMPSANGISSCSH